MGNKVITTTTNSIQNAEIEIYLDLISTNVVIGTNLFSDFGASLTDLFGGFSDSYQNKLQKIYSMAIDNLKIKAANIGANAILGLKIDFDEISGKGKSMFMISAIGTAVVVKFTNESNFKSNIDSLAVVSNDQLEVELTRQSIISNFYGKILPSQDNWIFLFNNPIEEIAELLLDQYLYVYSNNNNNIYGETRDLFLANAPNYFNVINKETAINLLYKKIEEEPIPIIELIKKNKMFSPAKIIELIKADKLSNAIDCLSADKEYYSKDDLKLMMEIIILLEKLPSKGKIELVKTMLGKSKEKYICPIGHSNDVDEKYCLNCGLNINGISRTEVNRIEKFNVKVDSLLSIFNKDGQY
ncbi:MAG TPA: YbjQ family protein [Prolixibacteraceae bacterium]|jgi:uncharacterized protein YbjQ (UPF0145 family)|nr:YbjQ family protein [Prolixibacteraceae bacterium]